MQQHLSKSTQINSNNNGDDQGVTWPQPFHDFFSRRPRSARSSKDLLSISFLVFFML
jgi:hypothetical protein